MNLKKLNYKYLDKKELIKPKVVKYIQEKQLKFFEKLMFFWKIFLNYKKGLLELKIKINSNNKYLNLDKD